MTRTGGRENIVLLLTGTIHVYDKHYTILTDPLQRKQHYVTTIKYYLEKYPFPIVFVENSNENLSYFFTDEIKSGRLEVLTFDGNHYPPEFGKGLGELKCIGYAVEHATSFTDDSFIFKITGRYQVINLQDFIVTYEKHPSLELLADLTNNFRFSSSAIVGFKRFFIKKYLLKNASLLNDKEGFYFEHALAKAVLEAIGDHVDFKIFKHYPRLRAISGTTGKPYKKSFLYMLPRRFKYWLRYYVLMR